MSGITSGVGLLSGLPTQDIINQLIAVESRPLLQLQSRVEGVQQRRTALGELSARLLGLKSTITRLDQPSFFRASKATSSNDNVLTATAGESAVHGSFQFRVHSLVSNHQLISSGFANADSQPVGAGTLSIEIGNGRLNDPTAIANLNGGDGIRRGVIEITDSAGEKAEIDLSSVLTVEDVLRAINNRADIATSARVEGDHLVIEDQAGGTGQLSVRDLSGHAAADLGIAKQALFIEGQSVIAGDRVIYLTDETRLANLNDGNGVTVGKNNKDFTITVGDRVFDVGLRGLLTGNTHLDVLNDGAGVREGSFTITNRAGDSATIVIDDSVRTIGDVMQRINGAGIGVTASVGAVRGQLVLNDGSTPAGDDSALSVENVEGFAAADLGIAGEAEEGALNGNVVYRVQTLGDVLRAINYAVDADGEFNDAVKAQRAENGHGIELVSLTGETFTVEQAAGAIDSTAAADLGILGESNGDTLSGGAVLAGLNTVLVDTLRGGSGVELGEVLVRAADGSQAIVDLKGAATVQEIIDRFNAAADGSKVTARLNDAGTGIRFEDTSGAEGTTLLKDYNPGGGTVRDLFDLGEDAVGARVESTNGVLNTGNVQRQYISNATLLADLNNGKGVATGSFRITASNGQSASVLLGENQTSIRDVIAQINAAPLNGIEARINNNGDGIEIVDTTGGENALSIVDLDGGTTARDLNILGEGQSFTDGEGQTQLHIDGSFERRIDIDADDTLQDVRDKINAAANVRAGIVNDGGANNAYHLTLASRVSGVAGEIVFDTGDTNLSFDALVRAQDAVVFLGGAGGENRLVLSSSSNTLTGVLEGVTINLNGTSDEPVELSVTQDLNRVVADLQSFVSSYNTVLDKIDELTAFNTETNERAVLFGDSTVNTVVNRLRSTLNRRVPEAVAGLDRLTQVGVRTSSGGRLTFDEQRFREAYEADPEAVETLFTTEESGVGDTLENVLDEMTRSVDGLIPRKDQLLADREELFNERIEGLQELLDRKRARLERQFQGLESSLAQLQGAQSALSALTAQLSGV